MEKKTSFVIPPTNFAYSISLSDFSWWLANYYEKLILLLFKVQVTEKKNLKLPQLSITNNGKNEANSQILFKSKELILLFKLWMTS